LCDILFSFGFKLQIQVNRPPTPPDTPPLDSPVKSGSIDIALIPLEAELPASTICPSFSLLDSSIKTSSELETVNTNICAKKTFTRAQINARLKEGDTLIIFNNKVYNLTKWIPYHPGGPLTIQNMLGRNFEIKIILETSDGNLSTFFKNHYALFFIFFVFLFIFS